jgi:hypothetical protein
MHPNERNREENGAHRSERTWAVNRKRRRDNSAGEELFPGVRY